jgi:uncharacterized circularly permuted ATP-grasp superfamily protein
VETGRIRPQGYNYIYENGTDERGLAQRVMALNLYLRDIYCPQRILKDRIIPQHLVYSCKHFRREMVGLSVPRDIYVHVAGIDLVRDSRNGEYLML